MAFAVLCGLGGQNFACAESVEPDSRLGRVLAEAIRAGDEEGVEALLEAGAQPMGTEGSSPLLEAVLARWPDMVRLLLEHGADPNQPFRGDTPFGAALWLGEDEIAVALLEAGADPRKVKHGRALDQAAMMGMSGTAKRLVRLGHDPASRDAGRNAIDWAIVGGSVETLRTLLEHDPDYLTSQKGVRLLHLAAESSPAMIQYLLGQDVRVGVPILDAVIRGDGDAFEEIVAESPDALTAADAEGWTVLGWAAARGRVALLKRALELGVSSIGSRPVSLAVRGGHREVLATLLEAGADPESPADRPPLVEAARLGRLEIARDLLERSADPDAVATQTGETALFLAMMRKDLPMTILLLQHGADPNIPHRDGTLPLSSAIFKEFRAAIPLLVEAGADPHLGMEGRTALELLEASQDEQMLRALELLRERPPGSR